MIKIIFHINWISELGAHTKNIPSHPIVEYHPYTREHYSQSIQQHILCNLNDKR